MDSKSIGLCPQGFESPRCRFAIAAAVAAAVGAAANMGVRFCSTAAVGKASYTSQHQESECHHDFQMPSRCSVPNWSPSPIGGSIRLMSIQAMARGAFFCKRLCEGRGICLGRVKEFVLLGSRSFPRQGQGFFVGRVEESPFPGRVKEFASVGSRNLPW